MNKKQISAKINELVYKYVQSEYPNVVIDPQDGGRVYFLLDTNMDNAIEYHQSRHEVCIYRNADQFVKDLEIKLNDFIKSIRITKN